MSIKFYLKHGFIDRQHVTVDFYGEDISYSLTVSSKELKSIIFSDWFKYPSTIIENLFEFGFLPVYEREGVVVFRRIKYLQVIFWFFTRLKNYIIKSL